MAEELAMVIINPYTLFKSRTGGVISRLLSRGNYELVGARMFSPSESLIDEYCKIEESEKTDNPEVSKLIVRYIRENYAANPATGARKRCQRAKAASPSTAGPAVASGLWTRWKPRGSGPTWAPRGWV